MRVNNAKQFFLADIICGCAVHVMFWLRQRIFIFTVYIIYTLYSIDIHRCQFMIDNKKSGRMFKLWSKAYLNLAACYSHGQKTTQILPHVIVMVKSLPKSGRMLQSWSKDFTDLAACYSHGQKTTQILPHVIVMVKRLHRSDRMLQSWSEDYTNLAACYSHGQKTTQILQPVIVMVKRLHKSCSLLQSWSKQ